MSQCAQIHLVLDEHGIGRCSRPMWDGYGMDAGFCDRIAYGKRPEGKALRDRFGEVFREDGRYGGYMPGLACIHHGGDGPRFERDGNMWCATTTTFTNLQESIAGFGETREAAEADLLRQHAEEGR